MTTPQSFRYVINLAMLLPEICNIFFCNFLHLKTLFFFPQPFHFYISVWCTGNAQRYALSLCLPLSFWHFPTTFISSQRIIHTFPTIEKPPYFSPMHYSVGGWICPPALPPNVLHRNLRLFEKRNSYWKLTALMERTYAKLNKPFSPSAMLLQTTNTNTKCNTNTEVKRTHTILVQNVSMNFPSHL